MMLTPDLQRTRWIIVVANFLVMLVVWTPYAGAGVFLPQIAKEFGWSLGTTASAFGLVLLMGGPLGLLVGKLIDRYGPQKVMAFEVLACSASFLLSSTMDSVWQLFVYYGLLLGTGFAGSYLIPTSTAARWFQEKRGLAVGIVQSAVGLAYLAGPAITAYLLQDIGWRQTFTVFGLSTLVLGLPLALVLRNPPEPSRAQGAGGAPATAASHGGSGPAPLPSLMLGQALHTPAFWMITISWSLQAFALMMWTLHAVPASVDKGVDLAAAAIALSSYGIGAVVGRVLAGALSDRLGASLTQALVTAAATISFVVFLIGRDPAVLYASAFVIGLGLNGADTALARALPDVMGAKYMGSIMSAMALFWRIGGALGPPFAGFFFDATQGYALPFAVGAAMLVASIGLFVAGAGPQKQPRPVPV